MTTKKKPHRNEYKKTHRKMIPVRFYLFCKSLGKTREFLRRQPLTADTRIPSAGSENLRRLTFRAKSAHFKAVGEGFAPLGKGCVYHP